MGPLTCSTKSPGTVPPLTTPRDPTPGGLPVPRATRVALIAFALLLAVPAASVRAATRMPIGFFDDSSFRFSAARDANLHQAAATGASVIHTTANWATLAPIRPADPSNGDD